MTESPLAMLRKLAVALPIVAVLGCAESSDPVSPTAAVAVGPAVAKQAAGRPLSLHNATLRLAWAVVAPQEEACGGGRVAGGLLVGMANISHLGRSGVSVSAAWDLDLPVADPRFTPEGPAGGPVATVLGRDAYPHQFRFDPLTGGCGESVAATGRVVFVAANGDEVHGEIVGGETHRLDYVIPGDGVETFAIIEIAGGTGRFSDATGQFVSHTIARLDLTTGRFDVLLAELLPKARIDY